MKFGRLSILGLATLGGIAVLGWTAAGAESPAPLLEQMSREAQTLYSQVDEGIVRVQLPSSNWAARLAEDESPLKKWEGLDPKVQKLLEEKAREYRNGRVVGVHADISTTRVAPQGNWPGPSAVQHLRGPQSRPATTTACPTTQPAQPAMTAAVPGGWTINMTGRGTIVMQSSGAAGDTALRITAAGTQGQSVHSITLQNADNFSPNNVGLLLDGDGNVLVPIYLEPDAIGPDGAPAMVGGHPLTTARFVASDMQSQITILRLDKIQGKPVEFAPQRPADGSLVLVVSPNSSSTRLEIWKSDRRDWGLVVGVDAKVAGFNRYGQFLGGASCNAIVKQLIDNGFVKRAKVGITVHELAKSDPRRNDIAGLGTESALLIVTVSAGSPAQEAGLQKDDVILSLAGDVVGDPVSFANLLSSHADKTPLEILRDGQRKTITLDLKPE